MVKFFERKDRRKHDVYLETSLNAASFSIKTEAAKQGSEQPATSQFRDITEDDDGYHPYADVPDTRPLFEPNPWD